MESPANVDDCERFPQLKSVHWFAAHSENVLEICWGKAPSRWDGVKLQQAKQHESSSLNKLMPVDPAPETLRAVSTSR
jgi:hypothetical protein